MKKEYFKKIALPSLALSTFFSLNHNTVQAADNSDLKIVPEKVETINLEDGTNARILEFNSEEEAKEYQKSQGIVENDTTDDEDSIPMKGTAVKAAAVGTKYSMVKYNGTKKYKMDVQYSYNGTSKKIPWTVKVERAVSSSTSISVGGEFKSVFKAEVGKSYSNSTVWTQSFKLTIPAKKQMEVWSWNIADSWIFSSKPLLGKSAVKFIVYRPTTSYGHDFYVYPKRDPR